MDQLIALGLGALASWMQNGKGGQLSKRMRYFVSLTACVIAGFLVELLQYSQSGDFDMEHFLGSAGVAFASSQTLYNTYFKPKN